MKETEAFQIDEGICRGDGCSSCGAQWVSHELNHKADCEFVAYLDRVDPDA